MSTVRLLVGTRKGAFILTSDGKRKRWDVSGPHFAGWELYHLKGSPVDPNRLYASQTSSWFGQIIQRSDDGGKTWYQPGTPPGEPTTTPDGMPKGESNKFVYDTSPETGKPAHHSPVVRRHAAPLGVQAGVASRTVADRSGHRLRRRGRRRPVSLDRRRADLAGTCRAARHVQGTSGSLAPGGCACTPSCWIRSNPQRIFIAISAAGAFRTDDAGKTWRPINRGLKSQYELPIRMRRSATACTASRCTRRGRTCCSCRSTGMSCAATTPATRGTKSAGTCRPTSASRSTCTRTSRRPSTSCRSRATRSTIRPTGNCVSTAAARAETSGKRSRTVCRNATATSTCCATRWPSTRSIRAACIFGTTGGQVYASADAGDNWTPIVRDLPAVLSVEVQTLP